MWSSTSKHFLTTRRAVTTATEVAAVAAAATAATTTRTATTATKATAATTAAAAPCRLLQGEYGTENTEGGRIHGVCRSSPPAWRAVRLRRIHWDDWVVFYVYYTNLCLPSWVDLGLPCWKVVGLRLGEVLELHVVVRSPNVSAHAHLVSLCHSVAVADCITFKIWLRWWTVSHNP